MKIEAPQSALRPAVIAIGRGLSENKRATERLGVKGHRLTTPAFSRIAGEVEQ